MQGKWRYKLPTPQPFSIRIFNHTAAHDSQYPGGLKLLNRKAFSIARQKNPLHFIPVIHLPFVRPVKIQNNVPVPTETSFREVSPSTPGTLPAFSNLRHRAQEKGFHFLSFTLFSQTSFRHIQALHLFLPPPNLEL